jgi:hypothetical protein
LLRSGRGTDLETVLACAFLDSGNDDRVNAAEIESLDTHFTAAGKCRIEEDLTRR